MDSQYTIATIRLHIAQKTIVRYELEAADARGKALRAGDDDRPRWEYMARYADQQVELWRGHVAQMEAGDAA